MILDKDLYKDYGLLKGTWLFLRRFFFLVIGFFFLKLKKKEVEKVSREKFRGLPYLTTKGPGELSCTSCFLCVKVCPTHCIEIVEGEEEGGAPASFHLHLLKCLYCGYCEDICPEDAIRLGPESPSAAHAESLWIWDHHQLAFRSSLNEGEGVLRGEAHPLS